MKSTSFCLMILLAAGCDSNLEDSTPCFRPNGEFFQGIQGRVYKFTPEHQRVFGFAFYLGNPANRIHGGRIPCTNLPHEFQIDGLDVTWSGFDKGAVMSCGWDPAYGYVLLTSIEKAF
jgi:hypothetical protein